jgi:hypothetical protein
MWTPSGRLTVANLHRPRRGHKYSNNQNCLRRWRAGYAPRFVAASVDDKLASAPRFSIAVLPFENLTSDKETRTISPT